MKKLYISIFSIMLAFLVSYIQIGINTNNSRLSLSHQENDEEESEGRSAEEAFKYISALKNNEITGDVKLEWVAQAIAQADALRANRRANDTLNWKNLGPDNQGGRCRAFLISKKNPNVFFVGSVSGGLFRSTTYGQSWAVVNDKQENLSVNCITENSDGEIYYGTGESAFTNLSGTRNGSPAFLGAGVFKSTDGGVTFTRIPTTNNGNFMECNSMVSHPTDKRVWVATSTGIWVTNNGTTFSKASPGPSTRVQELKMDKNNVIWAANNGLVWKSDAGSNGFSTVSVTGMSGANRIALAISPQDPNYVYVQTSVGGAFGGVYRTTNGGSSWEVVVKANQYTDMFGDNNQGWYDNVICVDPLNKNHIYMGGVGLGEWDNVDGFRAIASQFDAPWSTSYIHADKHIITFNTDNNPPTMIVGTDGGLFFSPDRKTWTPMNRGFISLQLYNVAANSLGHVVGGAQDNGTQLINGNGNSVNGKRTMNAFEIFGGDGFDVEFSKFDPNLIFVSTQFGTVGRTGNGGQSSSTFWDERIIGNTTSTSPPPSDFNTTFTLYEDSIKKSKLFLAKNSDVWVAINPTDFANKVSWFKITNSIGGGGRVIEMDITSDGNNLFICKDGGLWRVDSIKYANYSLSLPAAAIPSALKTYNVLGNLPTGRVITSVNVDQANDNHVVVTLGGYGNTAYIYETNNALSNSPNWVNITGDLPNMPVYDAVIDIDNPKRIIVGTELGVWVSKNGGTNWIEGNKGLARVPVYELRGYEWKPWEGMKIYAGTHGRGFFECTTLADINIGVKKVNPAEKGFTVFPNPANKQINLAFEIEKLSPCSIEIYATSGAKMYTKSIVGIGKQQLTINTNGFSKGYYFARVTSNGKTATKKFLIQ